MEGMSPQGFPFLIHQRRNIMKNVIVFASLAMLTTPVAAFEVSGSAGVTSNYVWRAATQSMGEAVAQGNIGVEHNGFYADVWASQVNFDGVEDIEVDYSVGFHNQISEHVSYDIGYIRYSYLDAEEDAGEMYVSAMFGPMSATVYRDLDAETSFYEGSLSVGEYLALPVGLEGFVGRGEDEEFSYGVSVSKEVGKFSVSYTYTTKETEVEDSAHAVGLFYHF
jgi:uncharacterized protein (TIGR02001 family)